MSARCGTLLVPENRAKPEGRRIELKVVVIPSRRKPAAPDAFTYLAGGPGGAATETTLTAASLWSAVNETRDILLVDQRGTGASNPLACAPPTGNVRARDFVRACLRGQPGDMTQYGTRAAMDDLDAVRAALGYRTLDVYGASYGATAAQVYVKRHPSAVRTVVLDGGTAIDVPFYGRFAENAQRALDRLAARCAADHVCAKAYPAWRATFGRLVRAWDAHPVRTARDERTTGRGLAGVVQSMLLDAATATAIPHLVTRAAAGDYVPLNQRIEQGGPILQLMYWSIWCNEPWVGLGAKGPWHTDFDSYTRASVADHRNTCNLLPKRAEPRAAWTFPSSRVPLLALAGGADPQDPIENLPALKRSFPASRTIVVPGYGHTVGQYGCLAGVVARFVARGTAAGLDTRCVRAIRPPRFSVP